MKLLRRIIYQIKKKYRDWKLRKARKAIETDWWYERYKF